MTDEPREAALVPREEGSPAEGSGGQYEMWQELIDVERRRIQNKDRQFDVMMEAVSVADAADERLYQYQRNRLERDDQYRTNRFRSLSRMGWVILVGAVAVMGLIVFMIFWGTELQQSDAREMFTIAVSVAGALAFGVAIGQRLGSS